MRAKEPCPGLPGEACTNSKSRRSNLCKACSNKKTSRGKLAHLAIGSTPHGRDLYEYAYRTGDKNGYRRGFKEGYAQCQRDLAATEGSASNGGENGSSQ